MSDAATDLIPQTDAPPPDQAAPPPDQQQAQPPVTIPDDDAGQDAHLEESAIPVPDGGRMVDAERASSINRRLREQRDAARSELTTAKTQAGRVTELEQQIATLTQQIQQTQPYVQAYQAMTAAAQQAAPSTTEDDAEAEAYARDLDLFTQEGKPDVVRAKRILATVERLATKRVEQAVGPIHQQTAQERSAANFARAANTAIGTVKADPGILRAVWARLGPDLTATPEGAQHALIQAIGFTVAQQAAQGLSGQQGAPQPAVQPQAGQQRGANGQFVQQPQQPVGDPIFTEKAGGRDVHASDQPLSAQEQSYIKSMGITEKDYRESARTAPWLRR